MSTSPAVVMPVETDLATDTNGWTGPNGHDGIDLICPPSAPLRAMCRSRVVRVSAAGWWGNNPQPSPGHPISDGDGIIILEALVAAGPLKPGLHVCYGHAEHATVKVGDIVEAGQVIGKAGFARAWHVHFMLNDDAPVNGLYRGVGDRDPLPYLRGVKDAPVTPVPLTPCEWPGITLKKGSKGSGVKVIQGWINTLDDAGYSYNRLDVDGMFGDATEHGVKLYQSRHRLDVDGVVGPLTWRALCSSVRAAK